VASRTIAPDPAVGRCSRARGNTGDAGGGEFLTLFGTILEARPARRGRPSSGTRARCSETLCCRSIGSDQSDNSVRERARQFRHLDRFPALNAATRRRLAIGLGPRLRDPDRRYGFRPHDQQNHSALHQTALSTPSRRPQRSPPNRRTWNTFEIEARSASIKVHAERPARYDYASRQQHAGARAYRLQCHTGNVQFQNINIRSLPDSA
jgi:hypothetical protein